MILVLAGCAAGISVVVLHGISPSLFRASKTTEPDRQAVEASRDHFLEVQQESLQDMEKHPVYPYSVVPGGVRTVRELKWAADHDPVVRAHYAGFDYDHARVVRLVLAQTVYVSYRIGNKVYWTRHRVKLKKGETVITDGKMTARTRCANRVEEVPQQAASSSEPPAEKFDRPVEPEKGTAVNNPPVPFQSALLSRPAPSLGVAPPLGVYDPLGGGTWTPITPPPLPGVCGAGKKKNGSGELVTGKGKKNGGNPCGSGVGGEVPEPTTWLLVASGIVLIGWFHRHRVVRV